MKKSFSKTAHMLNFRVLIEQDEDGIFVASVPAIPGCHTQGETYEEAIRNIKEAIAVCVEEANENPSYKSKIDWSDTENKPRFFGIISLPVQIGFSL